MCLLRTSMPFEKIISFPSPSNLHVCIFERVHLYRLNILAEILRFGDREFYKDWWNAKTIDEVRQSCYLQPSIT